jgi:sigma-B regulation protein RsbU (phosphoserine phosphatase)
MKVLIVEDTLSDRLLLERELKKLGYTYASAPSAEAAMEILDSEPINVVVSDWKLLGLDGLDLCRSIRSSSPHYVYFILLTSVDDSDANNQAAREAGVDDFIVKSDSHRELSMRLHVAGRILGFMHQVQQLEAFLPVCSYCKKVRDDKDYWQNIESYLKTHAGLRTTHTICPECYADVVRPEAKRFGIDLPLVLKGASRPQVNGALPGTPPT